MKNMKLVYGDDLMLYCFGSVNREDTIARLGCVIPHVGNEEIRTQMFVLKEKIDQCIDDEDWELYFPKLLRNMAVYLDRDKEEFLKNLEDMRMELKRLEHERKYGPKYGYRDDDED